jgi:hypothetical protein
MATRRSAGKCGQICGDRLPKLRPSKADFEGRVTDWHDTVFLWMNAHGDCRAARDQGYPKSQSFREQKKAAASICLGVKEICRTTKKLFRERQSAELPFEPNPSPKHQNTYAEKHAIRGNVTFKGATQDELSDFGLDRANDESGRDCRRAAAVDIRRPRTV